MITVNNESYPIEGSLYVPGMEDTTVLVDDRVETTKAGETDTVISEWISLLSNEQIEALETMLSKSERSPKRSINEFLTLIANIIDDEMLKDPSFTL
ncbi:hypothetical protein [Paenibacillus sinopodophylli]|uniref:hypothetical protein n=1 Tax=Paenibacillus sinopodophylli TaxID=1837342 RepID=UPI00110CAF89|nr:hypothetical protein [Paenibacillus sinopodophylli]